MEKEFVSRDYKTIEDSNFSVFTFATMDKKDLNTWHHWSKGLSMVITKDGKTIKLDSEEIQQLVKSLPRTIGGSY